MDLSKFNLMLYTYFDLNEQIPIIDTKLQCKLCDKHFILGPEIPINELIDVCKEHWDKTHKMLENNA